MLKNTIKTYIFVNLAICNVRHSTWTAKNMHRTSYSVNYNQEIIGLNVGKKNQRALKNQSITPIIVGIREWDRGLNIMNLSCSAIMSHCDNEERFITCVYITHWDNVYHELQDSQSANFMWRVCGSWVLRVDKWIVFLNAKSWSMRNSICCQLCDHYSEVEKTYIPLGIDRFWEFPLQIIIK